MIKQIIKKIVYKTGTQYWLDKLIFVKEKISNSSSNVQFKKNNKDFVLPSDYFLYETYRLNYQQYKDDGMLSANEIIGWAKNYVDLTSCNVLEWGCGVSRIVRHLPILLPTVKVFGADINSQMIDWNTQNIKDVHFNLINYYPPTLYEAKKFKLIYAISVFTHIEDEQQEAWLKEINRILEKDAVFLFTSHGKKYFGQLSITENTILQSKGVYTKSYTQKGHRMMSTYSEPLFFRKMLSNYFEVLEYYCGNDYPQKVGGQDLWIVKKKN